MLYTLDPSGQQLSHNVAPGNTLADQQGGVGKDRSHRPYFLQAKDSRTTIVTAPYLSVASRSLCISAIIEVRSTTDALLGYIVLDIDLSRTIEFLMGDSQRRKFSVLMFKSVLGDGHMLAGAVEMMFSAAALLVALGVYVFLGAKAEKAMVELRQNKWD